MPPKTVKRGSASAGPKRTPRSTRGAPKSQNPAPDPEEEALVQVEEAREEEEQVVDVKTDEKPVAEANALDVRTDEKPVAEENALDVKTDEKPVAEENVVTGENRGAVKENTGLNLNSTDSIAMKENDLKESIQEYEKDEQLELDDNEVEYDPEEFSGVDYDEKEMDPDELGEEIEEEEQEQDGEEKEGDIFDDEDVQEVELEGDDEECEHAGEEAEEHADLTYEAENEERHQVVQDRRKRKEFEVFVGGLDKDATEDDIRKVFSQVGEIVEVRLLMNPQTMKNKGFAFLRFATAEQAKRAFTELKNPVINGKQCGVTPSQDNDTLFLGNICRTWTKEALKEKLKHYGVDNVEDLTLVEDTNNEGLNRGFAFLEFASRSGAMDAFKRLQRRDVLFGVDRPAKVSFADSFIDPGDEIMQQVRTIFIDCLPPSWDEDSVRELLKKYGVIEKIELARNMPSADRKDYGFVTFDSHDAAVTCAKSINNVELGEGDNKAKVRARLSRPHQRGRGKHHGRDSFRSGHGSGRVMRGSWSHPPPRGPHPRDIRGFSSRVPPPSLKRPVGLRDRRPVTSAESRGRPLAPPPPRSYDRRAAVPPYPKSTMKREYSHRNELPPPRSRAVLDYGSRMAPERRNSYRDEYSSRNSGYSDIPRSTSRPAARRPYIDDAYAHRFERPPPSYHEGRGHDYDSMSGSKRPYSAMDDVPPRYAEGGDRHLRARLDYELAAGAPSYVDAYDDRFGRSSLGYGGRRNSMSRSQDSHGLYGSRQDSHGLYGSRQGMDSGGGSFSGSDAVRTYPSSGYGGDYMRRGSDVGGSSYSSMYSSRGMSGSSYMGGGGGGGGGGSGSYY